MVELLLSVVGQRGVDALAFLLAFALTALMDSVFHDSLPLSFDLMFFDIIPQEQAAVGGTQQIL